MLLYKTFAKRICLLISAVLVSGAMQAQTPAPKKIVQKPTPKLDLSKAEKLPTGGKIDPNDKTPRATGTIKDAATGKAVSGAKISVPNFSAAITDDKGNFSIKVPAYNISIYVNADGYQAKEIALKGKKVVSTYLYEETFNSVYDVINLPFGAKPFNQTAYAVSSVNTNGNWGTVNETSDSYLQGKASGVTATRRSGTPGVGTSMFLRGFTSVLATNQPLIILDGIIFDNVDYGVSVIENHNNNPLQNIDPKDIENITILKDASSMYGTKGANGAIIITTTHAKDLATKIDFAAYTGINDAPSKYPILDADNYRTYLSDLLKSKGLTDDQIAALPYMNDSKSNPNYYRFHTNTDWQNQVLKNSQTNNFYLKITGGDNVAKYALSMGYLKSGGVISGTSLNRYNTRFNADFNLTSKLTATSNLSFTYSEQKLTHQGVAPKINPLFISLVKAPFLPINEISDAGVVSPNIADKDTFNISNPVAILSTGQAFNKNYRFFGNLGFKYDMTRYLSLATTISITYDKIRENTFTPRKGVVDDTLQSAIADSRSASQVKRFYAINNDTRLVYSRKFDKVNEINMRAGLRYQVAKNEIDILQGYNSATDNLVSVGTGVNALRQAGGELGKSIWLNMYGGVDYSRSDKYFLSFNIALDGSSRFGKQSLNNLESVIINGNKYAAMPSIAAAWLLSSEKFMARAKWIELLKLRASLSLSGNDDIGNYTAHEYYVSQNYWGMQGLVRGNIANPKIQWETVKKLNVGVDAAFFNERLNVSVDVYQNSTSNMLTLEKSGISNLTGNMLTNAGAMRTKGIDVSINTRLINKKNFKWDLGLNLTHYKNEITDMPAPLTSTYAGATILTAKGSAVNVFYGYKTSGIYSTDAAATADGLKIISDNGNEFSFSGGDMKFIDVNGDKYIDSKDMQIIGNPNPEYSGMLSNKFEYKRISLEALFTFSKGNDVYNYTRAQLESENNAYNQTYAVRNRWTNNNQTSASLPKASWGDPMGNSRFSDRWIEDGSYFRLRTLTIAYQLPVKPSLIKYVNIYATGNNLFTLTKYKGFDPEFSATGKVIGQGIDVTLEPQFVSATMGIRIGL